MYAIILLGLAVLAATVHQYCSKKSWNSRNFVERLLSYIIPLNVGVVACVGCIAHLFYGEQTASLLGWPPDNPFQLEVGTANLALSIAGFLCIWQRKGFWLATASFSSIYYLGAAYGRYLQMMHGFPSPYKTYPVLLMDDVAIPLVYMGLAIFYAYQNKFFRS